jgi:hypothetical protein
VGSRKTAKEKRERPVRAASKRLRRRNCSRVTAKEKGESLREVAEDGGVKMIAKRVVKRLSLREVTKESGK